MAEATPDGIADGYASELRREILRSEIQRVQVLAIVLAILLVTTVTATQLLPGLLERIVRGRLAWWEPLASIGPFALYEFIVLFVLSRRASRDGDFPRYARFANAFIETSLPSVMILMLSRHMEPTVLFGFWPPLLYFVFILLSTLRLDFWLSLWTGAVAAVQQLLLVFWLIPLEPHTTAPEHSLFYHSTRSIALFGAGVIAGIVAGSLRRQFDKSVAAAAARDRITNMFGQHVSPAVVDRLLASRTDPPSEMREVCVLFLDIRGFTAMTRVRPAGETVALLNDFFAEMIDVVDRNHGIINKFLGDGFLALFGAPLEDSKAAVNALAAARGMLEAVDRWNKARPQTALRVGIGIHLGEAVTGTVGSPQRKEYTVIGDTVNLAARLEQLTKETGSQLLVSSTVHRATTGADGATDLGPLPIRGYDEEVRVWKVV
jgi:adenylate cyclase